DSRQVILKELPPYLHGLFSRGEDERRIGLRGTKFQIQESLFITSDIRSKLHIFHQARSRNGGLVSSDPAAHAEHFDRSFRLHSEASRPSPECHGASCSQAVSPAPDRGGGKCRCRDRTQTQRHRAPSRLPSASLWRSPR